METLVLSSAWEPLARVPWERAVVLLWQGKVEVVEEYADRQVRSVTVALGMPSVIRFVRNARRSGKKCLRFSRDNVYVRDGGRCQYCAAPLSRREATYDHVVPRARGGLARWENIVLACVPCNQRKGCRTPEEAGMALRADPVRPRTLPGPIHLMLQYDRGMPPSWRKFLRDMTYWHGALEEE